jgi:hypothetical protein
MHCCWWRKHPKVYGGFNHLGDKILCSFSQTGLCWLNNSRDLSPTLAGCTGSSILSTTRWWAQILQVSCWQVRCLPLHVHACPCL